VLRLFLRTPIIVIPPALLLLADYGATRWLWDRISSTASVTECVATALLGSWIVAFAICRHGSIVRQAIEQYRTCGFVYSQDHVVELSLIRATRLFIAGVALIIPGFLSDLFGVVVLFFPPIGWLAAQWVLDATLPGAFERADDVW
jgi:UPF0716 family protein affecting phage T7 exclusion